MPMAPRMFVTTANRPAASLVSAQIGPMIVPTTSTATAAASQRLLPDGKRRSRSLDQDRAASKLETFATLGLNGIATRRVHSSNATRPRLSGVMRPMHRALGQRPLT
jgi:hypothetical protein